MGRISRWVAIFSAFAMLLAAGATPAGAQGPRGGPFPGTMDLELRVTGAEADAAWGTLTLAGRVTCRGLDAGETALVRVHLDAIQYAGRRFAVRGFGGPEGELECTNNGTVRFEALVIGENAPFRPGRVIVRGFAEACVPTEDPERPCSEYGSDAALALLRARPAS